MNEKEENEIVDEYFKDVDSKPKIRGKKNTGITYIILLLFSLIVLLVYIGITINTYNQLGWDVPIKEWLLIGFMILIFLTLATNKPE